MTVHTLSRSIRRGRAAPPGSAAWLTVLLALVLAAAGLVAVAPLEHAAARGAASATADAPHRWAGYRIPRNGHADGGWMGGYQVDGTALFVTTPTKRPNRRGFGPVRVVEDGPGQRGASRSRSIRAAWVLSKYGGYRDRVQAAAVDAVVYHLLAGGAWRITHRRGNRRIHATGNPATVRRFARIMLRQSRRSAGAYTVTVTPLGADVGGSLSATVSVTDGGGNPASGLPVTIAPVGADPVSAVTGDDGNAVARFPARAGGWQQITATVSQVPEHRLLLREPLKRRQATAAEGGARRTLVVTTVAAVRGPQTLSLAPSRSTLTTGEEARVVATVTGDGGSRTVTGTLHGPFASAGAAGCSGAPVAGVSASVAADGVYTLPAVTPGAGGFYAWQVKVDGTATSLPVSACGGASKVMARTQTTISGPSTAIVGNVNATVAVSGLPLPARVELTVLLFGPYPSPAARSADDCTTPLAHSVTLRRVGDGSLTSGPIWVEAGYYAWQSQASSGELWHGAQSGCLASGTLMQVTP